MQWVQMGVLLWSSMSEKRLEATQRGLLPRFSVASACGGKKLRMLLYMCSDASTDSSHALYQEYSKGENATYVWNWGNHRNGSFVFEEQPTSLSRYVIDFRGNLQTNGDNGRRRSIRIVWIDQDDEEPRYTGQKLQQ